MKFLLVHGLLFQVFPHGGGFEFKIIKDVVFISIEVTGLGASDAGG